MKVLSSYTVRGQRVSRYVSTPTHSIKDLTSIRDNLAWVADQTDPRIEILES